jgi:hypothetical protein
MAKYVLDNQSQRLIHVPLSAGTNDSVTVVPGTVQTVEVSKENDQFFKATVKDVQGLKVLTEAKYAEYLKNKAAMEAALSDDEPVADEPAVQTVPADAAPVVAAADGWVR